MADIEATARNDEKFSATSRVGDFELSIDATGNDGPTPDQIIVADYAACYSFAFRAGADRERVTRRVVGHDDLVGGRSVLAGGVDAQFEVADAAGGEELLVVFRGCLDICHSGRGFSCPA